MASSTSDSQLLAQNLTEHLKKISKKDSIPQINYPDCHPVEATTEQAQILNQKNKTYSLTDIAKYGNSSLVQEDSPNQTEIDLLSNHEEFLSTLRPEQRNLQSTIISPLIKRVLTSDYNVYWDLDDDPPITLNEDLFNKYYYDEPEIDSFVVQLASPGEVNLKLFNQSIEKNSFIIDMILNKDPKQKEDLTQYLLKVTNIKQIGFEKALTICDLNFINKITQEQLGLSILPAVDLFKSNNLYFYVNPKGLNYNFISFIADAEKKNFYLNTVSNFKDLMKYSFEILEILKSIAPYCFDLRVVDILFAEVAKYLKTRKKGLNTDEIKAYAEYVKESFYKTYELIKADPNHKLDIEYLLEEHVDIYQTFEIDNDKLFLKLFNTLFTHILENYKVSKFFLTSYSKLLLKLTPTVEPQIAELLISADKIALEEIADNYNLNQLSLNLDMFKIQEKLKESATVQNVITKLREEEENQQSQADTFREELISKQQQAKEASLKDTVTKQESPAIESQDQDEGISLDKKAQLLLESILIQNAEVIDLREFNGLCVSHQYMSSNSAIESLNEYAFEKYDEPILEASEEEGVVYVTIDLLKDICSKFKK